jgi:zona occludens toxin (predicted ATPase)
MRNRWRRDSRWRDQRGAVLVELSFAIVLLLTLVFGMITFGLILSFKQGMTQAASDGARAAAVASVGDAAAEAETATARSVAAFDKKCNVAGLTCTFGPPKACDPLAISPPAVPQCLEVKLVYDYDQFPLLPKLPLLSALLPGTLTSASDVQVNS